MARRLIFFVLMAPVVLAPFSVAQMHGGFRSSARRARGLGASFHSHYRYAVPSGYFLGDTAFFYDDYPFGPAAPEPQAPPFIAAEAPAVADTPSPKSSPLLIELQGNRYVRYGGVAQSSQPETPANDLSTREMKTRETMTSPDFRGPASARFSSLPRTVLVYRDGHREEIPAYAIVGQIIYAHKNSDDGQPGYGVKNIQLSALDIPATMNANRDNGVSFVLPAGPNEVVTRP